MKRRAVILLFAAVLLIAAALYTADSIRKEMNREQLPENTSLFTGHVSDNGKKTVGRVILDALNKDKDEQRGSSLPAAAEPSEDKKGMLEGIKEKLAAPKGMTEEEAAAMTARMKAAAAKKRQEEIRQNNIRNKVNMHYDPDWQDKLKTGKAQSFAGAASMPVMVRTNGLSVLKCKSGEDITDLLQKAIKEKHRVLIPKGSYILSEKIYLDSEDVLKGEDGTELKITHDDHAVWVQGTKSHNGPAKRAENVTAANLKFVSDTPRNTNAIIGVSVKKFTVMNIETVGLGAVRVTSFNNVNVCDGTKNPMKTGGLLGPEYLSDGIIVKNCRADCGSTGGAAGILMEYCRNFVIQDCSVKNCSHGIQYWGGDSEYSRGGLAENFGCLDNGKIINCSVTNVGGGGIWGSLGQNITVKDCQVSDCMDVGIDFEGSRNAAAEHCTVRDCTNGNYATFMRCLGRVVFRNCKSYISGANGTIHFANRNATQTAVDQDITFTGCLFESKVPSCVRLLSAVKRFCFKNNKCINTTLNTSGNNILKVIAENNTFDMSVPLGPEDEAVLFAEALSGAGGEVLTVTGNRVKGGGAETGILISSRCPAEAVCYFKNNKASDCKTPIRARAAAGMTVNGDFEGMVEDI